VLRARQATRKCALLCTAQRRGGQRATRGGSCASGRTAGSAKLGFCGTEHVEDEGLEEAAAKMGGRRATRRRRRCGRRAARAERRRFAVLRRSVQNGQGAESRSRHGVSEGCRSEAVRRLGQHDSRRRARLEKVDEHEAVARRTRTRACSSNAAQLSSCSLNALECCPGPGEDRIRDDDVHEPLEFSTLDQSTGALGAARPRSTSLPWRSTTRSKARSAATSTAACA